MRTALASALLLGAFACSKPSTEGSTASTASAPSPSGSTSTVSAEPSVGVSKWTKDSAEPHELAVATDRVAYVAYEGNNGGYVFHRGAQTRRLPAQWFGVGPARSDLSISGDGRRLAVPDPAPGAAMSVTIYDTDAGRFFARFDLPLKDAPDAGAVTAKISVDAKYVVWIFDRHPCMVTDIETKVLDVDGAKHKKCSGS